MLLRVSRIQAQSHDVISLCQNALCPLVEELEVDAATFYLREDHRLRFAARFHSPGSPVPNLDGFLDIPIDDDTLHGRAANSLRPVIVSRENWPVRSRKLAASGGAAHAAVLPLAIGDRLVGTFMAIRNADRPFTPEEVTSLEGCAAHMAVAIDQARLLESQRRRADELQRMLDLGRSVSESLELKHVLRSATRHLAHITGATLVIIYLRDANDTLQAVGAFPVEDEPLLEQVLIPLTETNSATVTAVKTRAPVRVPTTKVPGPYHRGLVERYGVRSLCALPLTHRDEALGAVLLADSTKERSWEAEVETATVFARQVSAAVVNARLYESLKQSLSEVERSQKQLVAHERLVALGELSAIVAHEVRNPLGVIFNAVSRMRSEARGESASLLVMVAEEAERLNRLTEGLLAFARPQPATLSLELLAPLLHSAVDVARFAVPAARTLIREDAEPGLDAMMDASMIRQALVNLLVNALHATAREGDVTVSARAQGSNRVHIEVQDTGPGIPSELRDRVFEPFFTTKATGSGLGLAIVKRIVEAHQGELRLETNEPHGCRFVLELPQKPAVTG